MTPEERIDELTHTKSCSAWHNEFGHEVNGQDCTCGLIYRIHAQTAETVSAAWRKRATEDEERIAELEAVLAEEREKREAAENVLREIDEYVRPVNWDELDDEYPVESCQRIAAWKNLDAALAAKKADGGES